MDWTLTTSVFSHKLPTTSATNHQQQIPTTALEVFHHAKKGADLITRQCLCWRKIISVSSGHPITVMQQLFLVSDKAYLAGNLWLVKQQQT